MSNVQLVQIGNPKPRPALSTGGRPGLRGAEKVAAALTVLGAVVFISSFFAPGKLAGWGPLVCLLYTSDAADE